MSSDSENPNDALKFLVKTLELYDKKPAKAGEILSGHSISTYQDRLFRPVCQFIFLTVLRNKTLFENCLESFSNKTPRPKLRSVAMAAMAEVLGANPEKYAKAAHSWVGFSKKYCSVGEAKFLNAFLRKFPSLVENLRAEIENFLQNNPESEAKKICFDSKNDKAAAVFLKKMSVFYSHPIWLIEKWILKFGLKNAVEILENNQKPSDVFFRVSRQKKFSELFKKFDGDFKPSPFENFYILKRGKWDSLKILLDTGGVYIQDPSTADAPTLLAPKCGENILDLCAAPGGKSALIADLIIFDFLKNSENLNNAEKLLENVIAESPDKKLAKLTAVDFGEDRINLLEQNFKNADFLTLNTSILNFNLSESAEDFAKSLRAKNFSQKQETFGSFPLFDAVLLDAPCSNTGVLRRRPDARYRISESDILNCAKIQQELLQKAAQFVKINGRFVYSTCSIENEENIDVAKNFLLLNPGFKLLKSKENIPCEFNDGSGAFLFERVF